MREGGSWIRHNRPSHAAETFRRQIQFETVDAMRVVDGKITEHWGVANLFSLMQQLGASPSGS